MNSKVRFHVGAILFLLVAYAISALILQYVKGYVSWSSFVPSLVVSVVAYLYHLAKYGPRFVPPPLWTRAVRLLARRGKQRGKEGATT